MTFDIVVEYRKGKSNGNADGLSRIVDEDMLEAVDEDIEINALSNNEVIREQQEDDDIKWLIDLSEN